MPKTTSSENLLLHFSWMTLINIVTWTKTVYWKQNNVEKHIISIFFKITCIICGKAPIKSWTYFLFKILFFTFTCTVCLIYLLHTCLVFDFFWVWSFMLISSSKVISQQTVNLTGVPGYLTSNHQVLYKWLITYEIWMWSFIECFKVKNFREWTKVLTLSSSLLSNYLNLSPSPHQKSKPHQ